MAVTMSFDEDARIAELSVNGRIGRSDWDAVAPDFEAFIARHGTVRLIEVVHSLEGFDPTLIWDGIRFDVRVIPHISHCAVVSDIAWMSPLAKAAGAVAPMQLRTFPLADLDAARDWIAAD